MFTCLSMYLFHIHMQDRSRISGRPESNKPNLKP